MLREGIWWKKIIQTLLSQKCPRSVVKNEEILYEKTKKKYEKMQEEAKKKYDIDYKEWLENGGEEALKQAKDDKKEKKKASKSSK